MDLYKDEYPETQKDFGHDDSAHELDGEKAADYIQNVIIEMAANNFSNVRNNLIRLINYIENQIKEGGGSDFNIHIEPESLSRFVSLILNPFTIEFQTILDAANLVFDYSDENTNFLFYQSVVSSEFLSVKESPSQNYLELSVYGHFLKKSIITYDLNIDDIIAKIKSSEITGNGSPDSTYPIQILIEQANEPQHGEIIYNLIIHAYQWFKCSLEQELSECIQILIQKNIFPDDFSELIDLINDDIANDDFQVSIETARVLITKDPSITIHLKRLIEPLLNPEDYIVRDYEDNIKSISGFIRSYSTLNQQVCLMLNSFDFPRLAIVHLYKENAVTRFNYNIIFLNCICQLGIKKIILLTKTLQEDYHSNIIDVIRNTFEFENQCALEAGMYALRHIFFSAKDGKYFECFQHQFAITFPESEFFDLTEGYYPEVDVLVQNFKNEFLETTNEE